PPGLSSSFPKKQNPGTRQRTRNQHPAPNRRAEHRHPGSKHASREMWRSRNAHSRAIFGRSKLEGGSPESAAPSGRGPGGGPPSPFFFFPKETKPGYAPAHTRSTPCPQPAGEHR